MTVTKIFCPELAQIMVSGSWQLQKHFDLNWPGCHLKEMPNQIGILSDYKMGIPPPPPPFLNNLKNLNLTYKTDLDVWDENKPDL